LSIFVWSRHGAISPIHCIPADTMDAISFPFRTKRKNRQAAYSTKVLAWR
jgi:hypothetical protein